MEGRGVGPIPRSRGRADRRAGRYRGFRRSYRDVRGAEDRPAPRHDARADRRAARPRTRSEEHTSELQSLMRTSYAVFCLKKKTKQQHNKIQNHKRQETITA